MGTGPARAVPTSPTPAPSPSSVTEVMPPGPVQHATSYLPPAAPQVDPLIGQTLVGRYSIQKKLGEGGMGAVCLATHSVLEAVALKVLHRFARRRTSSSGSCRRRRRRRGSGTRT
jgi:hypothetical protein